VEREKVIEENNEVGPFRHKLIRETVLKEEIIN
jgi:hypothetical protein